MNRTEQTAVSYGCQTAINNPRPSHLLSLSLARSLSSRKREKVIKPVLTQRRKGDHAQGFKASKVLHLGVVFHPRRDLWVGCPAIFWHFIAANVYELLGRKHVGNLLIQGLDHVVRLVESGVEGPGVGRVTVGLQRQCGQRGGARSGGERARAASRGTDIPASGGQTS